MMSEQTDNFLAMLEPFGLHQDEAKVYLEMLEKREVSALEISRNVGIGRTKVYRILDKLIDSELVVQKLETAGFRFVANEPSKLKLLLAKKEGELGALRQSLPDVIKILENRVSSGKESRVLYYRGQDGLSRVNWNLLRARGEFVSYEVTTANAYLPKQEAEKLRQEIVNHKIKVRSLTNARRIEPFTKVSELMGRWCEIRYIPAEILDIKMDVFIYNNVFTVCHYLDNREVFCIETENAELAYMQKQMFELLWKDKEKVEIR